jgi:hypothetical protein
MLDHNEGSGYQDMKFPMLSSTEASSPHQNSDDGFFLNEKKSKKVVGDHYIHKVKIFDTLGSISLLYDVSKDLIRAANDFTGEEVFMFKELKIPNTMGPMHNEITHDPVKEELEKRKCAV